MTHSMKTFYGNEKLVLKKVLHRLYDSSFKNI